MPHKQFFGDAEHEFRLTAPTIKELERVTGCGIGALIKRVIARDFHHGDISETIRLALIGGGADPAEASALVNAYAVDRPLSQTYPLAVAILENLWAGEPQKEATDAAE